MVAEHTLNRPKGNKGGRRFPIPLPTKLKARSLYLVQQLSAQEIAEKLGMNRMQVTNLIFREKWTPLKQRAKDSLEKKHDARLTAELGEVHEAVALTTEELSLGTGDAARKALKQENAKDLQAYSQAMKNFYGMARQARGMDTQQSEGKLGSVVVFLGDLPRVSREEKRVEAIDLPPTQCPIPAIPMPLGEALPTSEGKDTGVAGTQAMD